MKSKKKIFLLAMMIVNVVLSIIAAFIGQELAWVIVAILWLGNIAVELIQQFYEEIIKIQQETIENQLKLIKSLLEKEV